MEWIKCVESLPPKDTTVVVYIKHRNEIHSDCRYDHKRCCWKYYGEDEFGNSIGWHRMRDWEIPTHWMLIKPPTD